MKKVLLIFFGLIVFGCQSFGYKISNKGKEFIKEQENFSSKAYWDSNGYSIGYGHHGPDVKKWMQISKSDANKLFNKDIKRVETEANMMIESLPYDYKFSQNFFDGLCSLIYNCGYGGILTSEFYKRLKSCRVKDKKMNKKDLTYTIAAVKSCNISAQGHISRRYAEHLLML